jgi:hypothetical protein
MVIRKRASRGTEKRSAGRHYEAVMAVVTVVDQVAAARFSVDGSPVDDFVSDRVVGWLASAAAGLPTE